jgi:hypothetical protein
VPTLRCRSPRPCRNSQAASGLAHPCSRRRHPDRARHKAGDEYDRRARDPERHRMPLDFSHSTSLFTGRSHRCGNPVQAVCSRPWTLAFAGATLPSSIQCEHEK